MTDTPDTITRAEAEKAPERIWAYRIKDWFHAGASSHPIKAAGAKDVEYIRADVAEARVAAALKEAAEIPLSHEPCAAPDAILALIPDASGAFGRAIAEAEARGHRAGRKHERDLIYAFMAHMDSEGKAYTEQILAATRGDK
jgi:hypothetical protein